MTPESSRRALAAQLLLVVDSILLGIGIAGPCLTVVPHFGEYTILVGTLDRTLLQTETFSVLEGVVQMYRDGHLALVFLIAFFSVIFPMIKVSVLWVTLYQRAHEGESDHRFLHRAEKLAKYSMVDVFIIALLVVAAKGLPGGTAIAPRWGMYAFAASVLLSLVLPSVVRRTILKESPPAVVV